MTMTSRKLGETLYKSDKIIRKTLPKKNLNREDTKSAKNIPYILFVNKVMRFNMVKKRNRVSVSFRFKETLTLFLLYEGLYSILV